MLGLMRKEGRQRRAGLPARNSTRRRRFLFPRHGVAGGDRLLADHRRDEEPAAACASGQVALPSRGKNSTTLRDHPGLRKLTTSARKLRRRAREQPPPRHGARLRRDLLKLPWPKRGAVGVLQAAGETQVGLPGVSAATSSTGAAGSGVRDDGEGLQGGAVAPPEQSRQALSASASGERQARPSRRGGRIPARWWCPDTGVRATAFRAQPAPTGCG